MGFRALSRVVEKRLVESDVGSSSQCSEEIPQSYQKNQSHAHPSPARHQEANQDQIQEEQENPVASTSLNPSLQVTSSLFHLHLQPQFPEKRTESFRFVFGCLTRAVCPLSTSQTVGGSSYTSVFMLEIVKTSFGTPSGSSPLG